MANTHPKILGTKCKQPNEVVPSGRWGVDFSNDTVTGESISSATITVTDNDGTTPATLVAGGAAISGVKVSCQFTSGTDGHSYHVQILATGSTGGVYDADFTVIVREA
jgi:hypothetical protein